MIGHKHVEAAAQIIRAYVTNNTLAAGDLPALIDAVSSSIPQRPAAPRAPTQVPMVPIKDSVTHDFIVCLEDGRKFKALKKHLRSVYGLTPDQYRQKWGLPASYPMVALAYSSSQSATVLLNRKKDRGARARSTARRPSPS